MLAFFCRDAGGWPEGQIYQILVREVDANAPVSVHLCEFPSADKSLMDEKLVERIAMVRGMVEMGRVIRATNNVKNRMPIASMTVVAHGTEEKNVAETMKDLILEELNVEEMKFIEDESSLVECSAKPNFLNIKSDFASLFGQHPMREFQQEISGFSSSDIINLQNGGSVTSAFCSDVKYTSKHVLIQRKVPEGMAVEANQHFTIALDLTVSDRLRRKCIARELVNRIQNRRKDQDFAITDRISIELYSESEVLKQAVKENESYIKGETQADAIVWKDSTVGLQESDADGEKVFVEAVR